eukprot:TRINITY_DN9388_c0_g1_i2.p1 TRINITY_DN9388_c0_g1~~TRINITY_DN9388_c0_g1_i2.p1  ORF type:complete len:206 (+),score=30.72 TRINITY_DN9388_c0_g1_i2:46-663(+)
MPTMSIKLLKKNLKQSHVKRSDINQITNYTNNKNQQKFNKIGFWCFFCKLPQFYQYLFFFFFFFQAEDGIRDHAQSRGLGDVYKRQDSFLVYKFGFLILLSLVNSLYPEQGDLLSIETQGFDQTLSFQLNLLEQGLMQSCLLYTSDAADDMQCVDLGGRRIIKKKKHRHITSNRNNKKQTTQPRLRRKVTEHVDIIIHTEDTLTP